MIGCCADLGNIEFIKQLGFDFVEIKAEEARFYHGFFPCKLNNLFPRSLNIFSVEDKNKFYDIANKIVNLSTQKGINYLTFGCGKCRIYDYDKDNIKYFYDFMLFFDNICRKANIYIGLEPLEKLETNFINNISEAVKIIQELKLSNTVITLDYYHALKEKEIQSSILDNIQYIKHIHIADDNRNFPIDISRNLDIFLKTLKQAGYKEDISVEIDWRYKLVLSSNIINMLKDRGF